MEILKRYYQHQGLVDKIKELETINLRLHGELEELAKARLDDIKSWNAAFDIERKNLLDKQYALEQQLLRVCGLISTEDKVSWLAKYTKELTLGDCSARLLESPYDFSLEGNEMGHCVAVYNKSCIDGALS